MITKRDQLVLNFIQQFKVATTDTLQELFYKNKRVTQRRLKEIIKCSNLKRERNNITQQYLYYFKKSKQLQHDLLLTNFFREFNKIVQIIRFDKELNIIEGIRPDGFIAYKYNSKNYIAFIEIEISNKGLNIEKYNTLYLNESYKEYFPVFPKVIVITNQSFINNNDFEIIKIDTDLSNIFSCLKQ